MKFKVSPTPSMCKRYWSCNRPHVADFLLDRECIFSLFALGTLIVAITIPMIQDPLEVVWYYFSITLGSFTNILIHTIIFGVALTPIGIIKEWMGFDLRGFTRVRKENRLLPINLIMLSLGGSIVFPSRSALAPFFYTMF